MRGYHEHDTALPAAVRGNSAKDYSVVRCINIIIWKIVSKSHFQIIIVPISNVLWNLLQKTTGEIYNINHDQIILWCSYLYKSIGKKFQLVLIWKSKTSLF